MYTFFKYFQSEDSNLYPTKRPLYGFFRFIRELLVKEENVAFVLKRTKKFVPKFLLRYLCRFTPYFYRSKIYLWDNDKNKVKIIKKPLITAESCWPILFDYELMRLFKEEEVNFYKEKDHTFVDVFWGQFNEKFFKKQNLKNSFVEIDESVFGNREMLTEIVIPNNVIRIESNAFSGCENLETVTIPKSVVEIHRGVFSCCGNLACILVDSENMKYSATDGVLFSKDESRLLQYPAGKKDHTYAVPVGVKVISDDAFGGCRNLVDVTIPDGVTFIGIAAFAGCKNLKNVTLPDSLTVIRDLAFSSCDSLESITIPRNILDIGSETFSNCKNLATVNILAEEGRIPIDRRTFPEHTVVNYVNFL